MSKGKPPFQHNDSGPCLNVGCGTWHFSSPWVNADVVKQWPGAPEADEVWDARGAWPAADETYAAVFMGHLLQHVERQFHANLLAEARRVLRGNWAPPLLRYKPELIVCEVDMDIVFPLFLADPSDTTMHELIWGEQGRSHGQEFTSFDIHVHGFTEKSLTRVLEHAGFAVIERFNFHHPDVWYELSLRARPV